MHNSSFHECKTYHFKYKTQVRELRKAYYATITLMECDFLLTFTTVSVFYDRFAHCSGG